MPLKLCAFDIETRGNVPEFVCGSVFSDATVGYYESADAMIAAMREHARQGYTFVAHHAEYDTAVLLWENGEDVSINYHNNTYSTASWRYGSGSRTRPIWDSMRLCGGLSLADLGQSIGLPKYTMPKRLVDPDDIRQDWVCARHVVPGCIECYVTRDAEIVWAYCNAMREWLEPYGLTLTNSLPRSAIELWRTLDPGQQRALHQPHIKALARAAYHGGRCEVFQYGHVGRVYTADIRSFYGSILRSIAVPDTGRLSYSETVSLADISATADGAVDATVTIRAQHVPPLPVAYHNRVYYPIGTCRGAWPISELRAALPYGVTVLKVHRAAWGECTMTPFQTTAGALIELRESLRKKGDAREVVAKFMLNAIPGRLGMRDESERLIYRRWRKGMSREDANGCELESQGNALYLAKRTSLRRPSRYANVLWAAIILGRARAILFQHLRMAGQSLLYCDTDSLHSLSPIPIEGELPGMLRDTGVYDTGIYLGSKFYSLETDDGKQEARAKGIPRKHAQEFVKSGRVAYQTALGVVDGILRGVKPCVWVDVDRAARFAPGTRTILEPAVLDGTAQRSATAPVAMTVDDADLQITDSRSMIDAWTE